MSGSPRRGRRSGRFALALLLFGGLALRAGPGMSGPALVFDTGSGEVLHAYMASAPWHPASLTKLMTAYVTFAAIGEGRVGLDTPVTLGPGASAPSPALKLGPGTTFSVEQALAIILAASLNAVAEALAGTVTGSQDRFVAEMNEAARRLGMQDTAYVNPHGLHDERQVTTARDLALLMRAIVREYPQHAHLFALRSVRIGDVELANHNGLLSDFPGSDGMKTGYVCESGYNLAATATREGRRLGAIVLGATSEAAREKVAGGLLKAGFAGEGGSAASTLEALPPAASGARPLDMRPYVCGKARMPAELASFGERAPLPRPKPEGARTVNGAG